MDDASLLPALSRIAEALERLAPPAPEPVLEIALDTEPLPMIAAAVAAEARAA